MKWDETIASHCRYGDIAKTLFGDAEIIWEDSEDNYQGHANILAEFPDGRFIHYEWAYGSCPMCDEWEARYLSDEQIQAEMRNAAAYLSDANALMHYLKLVPMANQTTNVGGEKFIAMGQTAMRWLAERKERTCQND